jgi:hypothetical protein
MNARTELLVPTDISSGYFVFVRLWILVVLAHDTLARTLALHVQVRRTCADAAVGQVQRARVRTEQVDTAARRVQRRLCCRSNHAYRCWSRCQRTDGACGFSAELGLGAQARQVGAGGEAAARTRGQVIWAVYTDML